MRAHPTQGISGSKPRGKTDSKLSDDYVLERTQAIRLKRLKAEMELARERGELISKSLVERQTMFIFVTLRAAILGFPHRYARHVVGLKDEHQAREVLTRASHEFLAELADFPSKAIDPGWLQTLDADGQAHTPGPPNAKSRPSTGAEIKREQERAKARRARKTQTMRNLRAKKG